MQVQLTCKCGEKYWPSQKWIHEGCGVVSPTSTTKASSDEVVVNAATVVNASNVVVNGGNARGKDRHKKTPARAEYIRLRMREQRRKKRALKSA